MARPIKQGVDYFPFDVHLDDKFKFIEIKYKLEGFAVVVKLLQRIYSQGYWCKWTEDEALLFADEIKADFDLVQNVVAECVKRDIFNEDLFHEYKILTSKGIQKRYKEIVRRRKGVEVIDEYLLIDNNFGINDDIKEINADINPSSSRENDGKSTQTKVNKTKSNKNNNTTTGESENAIEFYQQNFGLLSPYNAEKMSGWLDDFNNQHEILVYAMSIALDRNKRNWGYVESILKDWFNKGANDLDGCKALQAEFKTSTGTHKKQNTINWEDV